MTKITTKRLCEIEETFEYVPCLKCGSTDISFWNANESAFNYGGADCKNCKNKVSMNTCWTDPQTVAIDKWNSENDPRLLRAKYEAEISAIRAKIKALPRSPRKNKNTKKK
jgi:hypothetical protein